MGHEKRISLRPKPRKYAPVDLPAKLTAAEKTRFKELDKIVRDKLAVPVASRIQALAAGHLV
jgi:hypothetical protein